MSDLVFFAKMFALTVILVIAMQLQVGTRTVESYAMGFVQSSWVAQPINKIARGGAKLIKDATTKVHGAIAKNQAKKKAAPEAQAAAAADVAENEERAEAAPEPEKHEVKAEKKKSPLSSFRWGWVRHREKPTESASTDADID